MYCYKWKKKYSSTRPGGPSPASALEATIQGGTNQNCGIMFFVFLFTGFKSYFYMVFQFFEGFILRIWFYMFLYGLVWFKMVLSGFTWFYLVLNGYNL